MTIRDDCTTKTIAPDDVRSESPSEPDHAVAPTDKSSWVALALAAACIVPLILYAYLGRWDRYVGDDFWFLENVHLRGQLGAQVWIYMHWTGRFANQALIYLWLAMGAWTNRLQAAFLLTGWTISLFLCASRWLSLPKAALVATLIPVATLLRCPSVCDSLYWQAASSTYFPGLIIPPLLIAILAGRRFHPLLIFPIAFIGAGFSEITTVWNVAFLIGAAFWMRDRRVLIALAGSIIGAVLMFSAPGNAIRSAACPNRTPVLHAMVNAADQVRRYLGVQLDLHFRGPALSHPTLWVGHGLGTFVYITCLIAGLWMGLCSGKRVTRQKAFALILRTAAVALSLIYSAFFACQWLAGYILPARALLQPCAIIVISVMATGWIIGATLTPSQKSIQTIRLAAAFMTLALAVMSVLFIHRLAGPMAAFSTAWDDREVSLREGKTVVPAIVSPYEEWGEVAVRQAILRKQSHCSGLRPPICRSASRSCTSQ